MNNKKSIFWKFLLPILLIILIGGVLGLIVISYKGEEILKQMVNNQAYTVLRNAIEIVGQYKVSLAEYRSHTFIQKKNELKSYLEIIKGILDRYQSKIISGELSEKEAKRLALQEISYIHYQRGNYFFVLNEDCKLLAHPDPTLVGKNICNLKDPDGVYPAKELVSKAIKAYPQNIAYVYYMWKKRGGKKFEPKLSAAFYYPLWGWVVGTGLYLTGIEENLKRKRAILLEDLRAKIKSIIIGKSGYIYVFDDKGNMIIHPTLEGKNFRYTKDPLTGKYIFDELVKTAQKPWGQNYLEYKWNKPNDKNNYTYDKICWVAIEPITGWYVAISVYTNEILSPINKLRSMILYAGITISILICFAIIIILERLLNPIKHLTEVCEAVSQGDYEIKANENTGMVEIDFLCKQFNGMIESIKELRKKDEEKRKELEKLNEELELRVEERTKQLENKAKELEEANKKLKELDELKSSFLSSVSHELRTPLTSVLGFAKLIHKSFTKYFSPLIGDNKKLIKHGKRISENLEIIISEGERLTRLINDVLDLNKIESGRIQWRDTKFKFNEVLDDAIKSVQGQFEHKPDVKLIKNYPDNLPEIVADKDRILQVLINLLNNAAKFTDKGSVTLSAFVKDNKIVVSVKDTGIGIPEKELDKVFDKFHQVIHGDTLKDKPKGTGLGLPICKQIIQHYGGKIWVESKVGEGSNFIFELPLKYSQEVKQKENKEIETFSKKDSGKLILVCDDDISVREFLKQLLEENGYSVITAKNGKEAVDIAKKHKPDLIIMDMLMPEMDGKEAISEIKSIEELKDIPIIIVSVTVDKKENEMKFSKPLNEKKLVERINKIFRKAEENTDAKDFDS